MVDHEAGAELRMVLETGYWLCREAAHWDEPRRQV